MSLTAFENGYDYNLEDDAPIPGAHLYLRESEKPLVAGPHERLIFLTDGYRALIDASDYPLLEGRRFYAHKSRNNTYARNRALGFLHHLICGVEPGCVVDHKNRHSLDNRRNNLRVIGPGANANNTMRALSMSGYRGVTLKPTGRYQARIKLAGSDKHLGVFDTAEDAARAYDMAAIKAYGPDAWTNAKQFPRLVLVPS